MADHQHQHGSPEGGDMADVLDLDAEVVQPLLTDMTGWLAELAGDPAPRRILDLGSGTGVGTLALLRRFDGAEAVAVDASEPHLDRLRERADAVGVGDRVQTLVADLDAVWPQVETVDLVWASASLHHLAEPTRVLDEVFVTLRPDGLLAVLEMDSFPRFLPDDIGIGRPGLEARCHAALSGPHDDVPDRGADWGPSLVKAGFTVEADRVLTVALPPPPTRAAGQYAHALLSRARSHLADHLDGDDRAALDALLDETGPHAVLHRTDLTVHAERRAWVARHP